MVGASVGTDGRRWPTSARRLGPTIAVTARRAQMACPDPELTVELSEVQRQLSDCEESLDTGPQIRRTVSVVCADAMKSKTRQGIKVAPSLYSSISEVLS